MGSRLRFESFSLLHQGIADRNICWEDVSRGHILDTPDHYFLVVSVVYLCCFFCLVFFVIIFLFVVYCVVHQSHFFCLYFPCRSGAKEMSFRVSYLLQSPTIHSTYNKTKLIQYIKKSMGSRLRFVYVLTHI